MKLTKNTLAAGALTLALGLAFPVAARAQDGEMQKQDEKKPEEKKPEEKKPEGDQPRRGGGGGDRGPGGGFGGRGGRGGFGPGGMNMDELKKELGLTQEQVDKITEMQDEMRTKMREMFQGGGGGDRGAMREKMQELQKEGREKVRGLLKDDQKPKFDEFMKKMDERMQGMGGRGGPGGFGMNPEQRKKQLMDEAEKSLVLSAEEKSAIMPLVEKAIDARTAARTDGDKRREEFLGNVKKGGTPEEIKGKLDDYRKARDAEQDKVKAAQKALREVLTVEQEARLVALGILD